MKRVTYLEVPDSMEHAAKNGADAAAEYADVHLVRQLPPFEQETSNDATPTNSGHADFASVGVALQIAYFH